MRCLITLETRPCEDPINFKVLLLPIKLIIIRNIRLFAIPPYKGLTVGTPEQGKAFAINLVENVKETPAFLPLSSTCQKQSPSERTLSPAGLAPPSTPHPTLCWACWPQPLCSNIGKENLFPKDPRLFLAKTSMFTRTVKLSSQKEIVCQLTCLHFRMQKALETLQVSPYPTTRIQSQFFTCGSTPESSEVIHHRHQDKVRHQKPRQIHFSNLQPAQGVVPPLWKKQLCSLPKMPWSTPSPGWWRCDPTNFLRLTLWLPAGQEMLSHP